MDEIITVEAKHIFIDIVNYTYKRSVESQTEIIKILNEIVNNTIDLLQLDRKKVLFIPTGDGMCISLLNVSSPYDIHIQIGIMLLEILDGYNKAQEDEMRMFAIRIGINENIDNLIIDINNNRNISGSGINIASRIEGMSDGNQILVSNSVYDKLVSREKYMNSFVSFTTLVKHSLSLNIHQYKNEKLNFLNNEIPTAFRAKKFERIKLTEFEGYYLANCISNEHFIISKVGNTLDSSSLHTLMYFLTLDSLDRSRTTKLDPISLKRVTGSLEDFFQVLNKSNIWLNYEIRHNLISLKLNQFNDCFSENYLIVNDNGKNRLNLEQPKIYNKLNL